MLKPKCDEYSLLFKDKIPVAQRPTLTYSIGKVSTTPGEFPHMAALGFGTENSKDWLSGGSLISDQYILTSASSIGRASNPVKWVRLGEYNIKSSKDDAEVQEFEVSEIIQHPEYKLPGVYNDIALLKLNGKVKFSKNVRPACLYTGGDLTNEKIIATGWGQVEFNGAPSEELLKVQLDLFTNTECQEKYENTSRRKLRNGIVATHLCAGSRTELKNTCQGDSGGPLQILREDKNIYEICGIVSFGKNCFIVGEPAVYTRVSEYISWIESIVWP